MVVDKALRFPLFHNLEEIGGAYETKEFKRTVMMERPYQCGIAAYQLVRLRTLEFYYDFLDKYFSRKDFEFCYMDTDSFYLAVSGDSLDKFVKPEMNQAYEADKKNWRATDKLSERTPGLFEPESVGTRGLWLTAKCYLVQDEAGENKYSCKGVLKKRNDLYFQRYKEVLNVSLKTRIDSELEGKDELNKLGLSAYYDKRHVLTDGIHTKPLDS